MATKVSATTAPAVVNGSAMPNAAVEPLPDQPAAAEGQQQRDAADDRRQHHRQQ